MRSHQNVKYHSLIQQFVNIILFPLKLAIPQPIIKKIPYLLSNEDIRYNIVLQNIQGRLLDIGCGFNQLVREYLNNGHSGTGVDVFPWEGADLIVKDTSDLPFPDGEFDTITFVACFNHIPNRELVLNEANRILKISGSIIITNLHPFISTIWHGFNHFWSKDQQERGISDGEVMGFNRSELIDIVERNGFKLKSFKYFAWGLNQIFIFKKKSSPIDING